MPEGESPGSPGLVRRVRDEIREGGPISFARFMELALYDPEDGYYSRGAGRLGRRGDFFTASDAGRMFGRCMARQLSEFDKLSGPFEPFHVIEFGAGRGLLALDLLQAMEDLDPKLARRLRYVMVDRSAGMRTEARRRVPQAESRSPDELGGGFHGCVLAVELFDALPVHRVRRRRGELVEVFVDLDPRGEFVELESPPGPEVRAWVERYGAAAREASEAEAVPLAFAELDAMERVLDRGIMIVVDYGYRAGELYGEARGRGTLLAYHRHGTNERYLERLGRQDLTAHVNFSALEDRAQERGLQVLGLTTQDRFLIGNGILQVFESADAAESRDPLRVKQRLQAMQLIHPSGMGRAFKVLILSKACRPAPRLSGLRDPFARS